MKLTHQDAAKLTLEFTDGEQVYGLAALFVRPDAGIAYRHSKCTVPHRMPSRGRLSAIPPAWEDFDLEGRAARKDLIR